MFFALVRVYGKIFHVVIPVIVLFLISNEIYFFIDVLWLVGIVVLIHVLLIERFHSLQFHFVNVAIKLFGLLLLLFLHFFQPLGLDCEYFSFGVLVQHVYHQMGELNSVVKKLLVVDVFLVKQEGFLRNYHKVMVKHIG